MTTGSLKDIYPETISRGGLLVRLSDADLFTFLRFRPSRCPPHPNLLKVKALAVIELLYRSGVRSREAYEAVWTVILGDSAPPPLALEAPSQINPLCRSWVEERRRRNAC